MALVPKLRALYKRTPPAPATAGACPQEKTAWVRVTAEGLHGVCCTHSREVDTSQEQARLSLRWPQALAVRTEEKMSKQSRLDLPLQIFCRICIYQLHLRWLDASRTENLSKAIFQLITWKHEHFCRTSVKGSNAPCLPSSIPIVPCQFHWHSYFWGLEQFLGFNLKQFDELIQDVTCMLSVESHL